MSTIVIFIARTWLSCCARNLDDEHMRSKWSASPESKRRLRTCTPNAGYEQHLDYAEYAAPIVLYCRRHIYTRARNLDDDVYGRWRSFPLLRARPRPTRTYTNGVHSTRTSRLSSLQVKADVHPLAWLVSSQSGYPHDMYAPADL